MTYLPDIDISTRPLTARNLEDFAACPLKFMFSVTASKEETQRMLGGPAMLTRAVRDTLQELLAGGDPLRVSERDALDAFEARFESQYCADSREEDELRELGRRVLGEYVQRVELPHSDRALQCPVLDLSDQRRLQSATTRRDAARVASVNLTFEGEIDGQRFLAVADVVFETPEGSEIVRYTMARKVAGAGELGRDQATVLLHELAAQTYGEGPFRIVIEALRQGVQTVPDFGDGRREETLEGLIRLSRRIRDTREFAPLKGRHCQWCRSRRRCPQWQR